MLSTRGRLLNAAQLQRIRASVAAVEQNTDAELVTVLARQADNYYYIPSLWAALVALLLPLPFWLSPMWFSMAEMVLVQWAVFVLLALVLRWPPLLFRLVPRVVKQQRAAALARQVFLQQGLHTTQGNNGVLLFVCEAEHYVEILVDHGVAKLINNSQWQQLIDNFVAQVKAGEIEQGFVDCINACGGLLQQVLPATSPKNELPNHLVVL